MYCDKNLLIQNKKYVQFIKGGTRFWIAASLVMTALAENLKMPSVSMTHGSNLVKNSIP
jgi:hypothetical protein